MAEMDIYMRRRLVALGGLVAFFIIFVLLVKGCGGDDEPAPVAPSVPTTGATGEAGAALSEEDFILRADEICGPANEAVGALDPADPVAVARAEFQTTRDELTQLETLVLAEQSPDIQRFLDDLTAVVRALKAKSNAGNDVAAADAAQLELDTNEAAARESGERAGFADCGQFLDAGQEPTGRGGGAEADVSSTDDGTVVPPDDGTVVPPDDGTVVPPDDGTVTPPDTGGGGVTP